LTIFFAFAEYWKYFYCALYTSKVFEKFIRDKFEENQNTPESWIEPIPNKLESKSHSYLQQCIQNFDGYKGWRFLCTADETHMRSSIILVISERMFGVFFDGQEDFEGSFEFDCIHVWNFLVPIFVFWSHDMMASLNLALVKFSKFPLLQRSTS
jgi:hypothetical protein